MERDVPGHDASRPLGHLFRDVSIIEQIHDLALEGLGHWKSHPGLEGATERRVVTRGEQSSGKQVVEQDIRARHPDLKAPRFVPDSQAIRRRNRAAVYGAACLA
jgi:hypothetical protein